MGKTSKRFKKIEGLVDQKKAYGISEAVEQLKGCPAVKFDESIDISIQLGVDPRKSDQQVRGTVALPHGTGKVMKIVVLAKGEAIQQALDAGADFAGGDELITKIQGGWLDFNAVVATPDMMREVGKLGKVLGPRGLMPTPKAGTVTRDVAQAVKGVKAGAIEFKTDRHGCVNTMVGKRSFDGEHLLGNIQTLLHAVVRAKPASAKGTYVRGCHLSSTMGPGLTVDLKEISVI